MPADSKPPVRRSSSQEIDLFLEQARSLTPRPGSGRGRLLFALDATASRQPTWDHACQLQSEMFVQTRAIGQLSVKLCYYRGFREFSTSEWLTDTQALLRKMNGVSCLGGHTQIERLLKYALKETRNQTLDAVVFIGDCCEEPADALCQLAGELGLLRTPIFIFHEGDDAYAASTFKQMAQLSGGACCNFDSASAQRLTELLSAVAVYAVGGAKALQDFSQGRGALKALTHQLKR